MAGPNPIDAAQQYSEVAGKAAMMPYWGLGLHQCRYGYQDYIDIAEVIYNCSASEILTYHPCGIVVNKCNCALFVRNPLFHQVSIIEEKEHW